MWVLRQGLRSALEYAQIVRDSKPIVLLMTGVKHSGVL